MFRSRWIRPVLVSLNGPVVKAVAGALTLAGLAWGEGPQDHLIMVQEANKPAQKCRVLKTWVEKDGSKVCQVQDVGTSEQMTIVESSGPSPSGGKMKTLATRIFHWGVGSTTPPRGVPVAPENATVLAPCADCKPSALTPTVQQAKAPEASGKPSLLGWSFRSTPGAQAKEPIATVDTSAPQAKAEGSSAEETKKGPTAGAEEVSPEKLPDWRKSWGRVERWNPRDSEKADQYASDRSGSRPKPLLAEKGADDPLQHPEAYVKGMDKKADTPQAEGVDNARTKAAADVKFAGGPTQSPSAPQTVPAGRTQEEPGPTTGPALPTQDGKESSTVAPALPPSIGLNGTTEATSEKAVRQFPPRRPRFARLFGSKNAVPEAEAVPVPSGSQSSTIPPVMPSGSLPTETESAPVGVIENAPQKQGFWSRMFGGKAATAAPPDVPTRGPKPAPGMGSVMAARIALEDDLAEAQAAEAQAAEAAAEAQRRAGQGMPGGMAAGNVARQVPTWVMTPSGYAMVPGAHGPAPQMPPIPQMVAVSDGGTPGGLGNAFTRGVTGRPIPADMGPNPGANAFNPQGAMMAGMPAGPRPETLPPGMPTAAMMAQRSVVPPEASQAGVQPAGHRVGSGQVNAGTFQGMGLLRDSLLPSERERAAESLSRCDWKVEPQAAQALLMAARTDPAPSVRGACVRALARMKANSAPVVQGVSALKADPDLRVRQEVEQALAVLTAP